MIPVKNPPQNPKKLKFKHTRLDILKQTFIFLFFQRIANLKMLCPFTFSEFHLIDKTKKYNNYC